MSTETFTSITSGDWDAEATWDGPHDGRSYPQSIEDDAVIDNGHTVTLTGVESCKSLAVNTGGIYDGDGNILTILGESAAGWAVRFNNGSISGTDSDFTITTAATTAVDFNGSAGNPRHLVLNHASLKCNTEDTLTLSGDLTITAGELDTTGNQLTVTGATTLGPDSGSADAATLTCNASAVSLGSGTTGAYGLLVTQGGTFVGGSGTHTIGSIVVYNNAAAKCTLSGGVTTIDSEHTSDNYAINVGGSAPTFAHGDGVVIITTASDTRIRNAGAALALNNLIINHSSADIALASNGLTCAGGLIVTAGAFSTGVNKALTVTGDVSVTGTLTGNASAISMGSLTIASGGTYSATSGTTTITGTFDNNDTDPTTSFVHNDGTVKMGGVNTILRGGTGSSTGTHFYNLTQDGSGYVDSYEYYTVENTLTTKAGVSYYVNDAGGISTKIYIGKSGVRAGLMDINGELNLSTNGQTFIEGAGGPTLPALIDYDGSISGASGAEGEDTAYLNLTNINWDGALTMGSTNIKLGGDCEFDAVTVSSDAELDINGQRMETSGVLTIAGEIDTPTNSLMVLGGAIDFDGGWTDGDKVDIMFTGAGATNDFAGQDYKTIMFNGTGENALNWTTYFGTTNFIVASDFTPGHDFRCTDLTIATGATFDADVDEHQIAGDFNIAGGLIGKTGIYNDGIYNAQFAAAADQNPIYGSGHNFTVEGWWKFDAFGYQVLARSSNTGQWMLLNENGGDNLAFAFSDFAGGTLSLSAPTWTDLGIVANTWVHIAGVCDGTSQKVYINGKLVAEGTKGLGVGNGTGMWAIGSNPNSTAYVFDGHNHMLRMWREARTVTELRANMFTTTPEDDNTKLTANINYVTGGSGGTITDAEGNGDGVMYKTGHVTTTDAAAWAGGGAFTDGSSTLDFTGNGTWYMSNSTTEYYNVKVAASGKTTTLESVGASENRPKITGLLTHGGGTLTDVNSADINFVGSSTHTAGADLSGLYFTTWNTSAANPGGTYQYLSVNTSANITGDITATGYIQIYGTTDLGNNNITSPRIISYGSSSFTMGSGKITFNGSNGWGPNVYDNRSFSAGPGAEIIGPVGKCTFAAGNNWTVVGKCENLDVTNEELNVTGKVINCTGDIIQQHQSVDAAQQLDYDSADDRDIMLGRDLDKNTELVG